MNPPEGNGDGALFDVTAALRAVITEARRELDSPHWTLLPNERMKAAAYAAAGLAHCCSLAENLLAAHDAGDEILGRIIARAIFESWLVAYFIHHGGPVALAAVNDSYESAKALQRRQLQEHDDAVRARRSKVQERNQKIEAANAGIAMWNERNPERPPKSFHEPVPEPPGVIVGWDDAPERSIASHRNLGRPLSLMMMVGELRRLTRAKGQEETFDAAYHLAYRGLSNLGAHANMFVLDAYLDNRKGDGIFVRVKPVASVPESFRAPNLNMALLLVAGLAASVLGDRGAVCNEASKAIRYFDDRTGYGNSAG